MFDFHYDLLTKIYISYLNQDFEEVKEFCKSFHENNVRTLIANLSFETEAEMKEEYHIHYWNCNVGIKEMFRISTSLAREFIYPDIEIIYSIEGCDFVEIEDLEELYKMGLRSILLVWNHQNQYGSGNRTNFGLSEKGKNFIRKAVELGIAIDVSHMNRKTFYDTLELLEELQKQGKEVILFASHSNVFSLCNRERNLTDEQLLRLNQLGGKVGIFSNKNFIIKDALQKSISKEEMKNAYIEHIRYVEQLFGGIDSIVLSTDDMGWCVSSSKNLDYGKLAIYPYPSIKKELEEHLKQHYDDESVAKLLYKNGISVFMKAGEEE